VVDPSERNVAGQRDDPASLLSLYRSLIAVRAELGKGMEVLTEVAETVVAFERGDSWTVALNFGDAPAPAPPHGEVVLATHEGASAGGELAPHAGVVARRA
jgi:glycosidase